MKSSEAWKDFEEVKRLNLQLVKFENMQQKTAVLLLVRVTELCSETMLLVNQGCICSAPIILRSALESYIDMSCVIKSERHLDEMRGSFQGYQSKKEGKKRNLQPMSIESKFKFAGKLEAYRGIYADLCLSAHGSIAIAVADHAAGNDVSVGHEADPVRKRLYLNHIIFLASTALIECLTFLGFIDSQEEGLIKIKQNAEQGLYE